MVPEGARFSRQILFAPVGARGQELLERAHVLLVGLGAVGAACADLFCRAGFGRLTLVDRDVVDESNLPRQTLYDLAQARGVMPKAEAARARLASLGGPTSLEARVLDASALSLEELRELLGSGAALLCDATDNFETRYFLSDLAVEQGVPLAYAGAIGARAAAALFAPPRTPCMRCLFPEPPAGGTVETCDTAGVLGPAAHAAAALVVGMAMRHVVDPGAPSRLVNLDVWGGGSSALALDEARRDPDCRSCARRELPALHGAVPAVVTLCGRGMYQVQPANRGSVDLAALAHRLAAVAEVSTGAGAIRATLARATLTVFGDGRALVEGVDDPASARRLYAEMIGS